FSSRRRHTRFSRDWSSDVCSSDLAWGWASPLWPNTPTGWRWNPLPAGAPGSSCASDLPVHRLPPLLLAPTRPWEAAGRRRGKMPPADERPVTSAPATDKLGASSLAGSPPPTTPEAPVLDAHPEWTAFTQQGDPEARRRLI